MLGNLLKRLVNAAVLALAAVTYFLVPMGGKTLFQHTAAVFTSAPAREAGAAIAGASHRVARAVQAEVRDLASRRLPGDPPPSPDSPSGAPDRHSPSPDRHSPAPDKPSPGHDPRR